MDAVRPSTATDNPAKGGTVKNKHLEMLACLITLHRAVTVTVHGPALTCEAGDHEGMVATLREMGIKFHPVCPGIVVVPVDGNVARSIESLSETVLSHVA